MKELLLNCAAGCGTVRGLESDKIIHSLQALVLDGDGVLTDNTEILGLTGEILKARSHYDGQGISLLRAIGIKVMIATNASGNGAKPFVSLVEKWNGLPSVKSGDWAPVHLATSNNSFINKVAEVEKWLEENGIAKEECGVMGDDLVDLPLFKVIPFRAAPCTAEKPILDLAHFISLRPGGYGAVRDLANFILKVRGVDPTKLPCY